MHPLIFGYTLSRQCTKYCTFLSYRYSSVDITILKHWRCARKGSVYIVFPWESLIWMLFEGPSTPLFHKHKSLFVSEQQCFGYLSTKHLLLWVFIMWTLLDINELLQCCNDTRVCTTVYNDVFLYSAISAVSAGHINFPIWRWKKQSICLSIDHLREIKRERE